MRQIVSMQVCMWIMLMRLCDLARSTGHRSLELNDRPLMQKTSESSEAIRPTLAYRRMELVGYRSYTILTRYLFAAATRFRVVDPTVQDPRA